MLVQIDTGRACAGIIVEKGLVIEAAPIFSWMVGKSLESIKRWRRIKKLDIIRESTKV